MGGRLQTSGIHDIAWVQSSFDGGDRLNTKLRNVLRQPRQMLGTDAVVVG